MTDGTVDELRPSAKQMTEIEVLDGLSRQIGSWADQKGFREDWEDADFLDRLAENLYVGDRSEQIEEADRLREIANKHRRLANVCKLMLMVSELAEALEGMRDGGNYGEELGDIVIRILENADKNGISIDSEIVGKVVKNESRPYKHGRQF